MEPKTLQRFWSKVEKVNNCWIWTSSRVNGGYGHFKFDGRMVLSHRFSYELFNNIIPTGIVLDHLCRNPACVNPEHLDPVTQKENIHRGIGIGIDHPNTNKTHCPKKHEYTEENTYFNSRGSRECRICKQQCNLKYKISRKKSQLNQL